MGYPIKCFARLHNTDIKEKHAVTCQRIYFDIGPTTT
jgi:hypothetical protein